MTREGTVILQSHRPLVRCHSGGCGPGACRQPHGQPYRGGGQGDPGPRRGLLIAAVAATSQTAQAIGSFAFFPLMFFAGLWLPIPSMPPVLQHISHVTPLGAAVQALQYASEGQWPHPQQLLILLAYTVVLGAAAVKLFRWE